MDWTHRLLAWYQAHRRGLPWRDKPTPYRVWISEVMLQQTQVETVKPYFNRFVAALPDIAALAAADEQEVLRLWQGLGYYSRARRLQTTARRLMADHGGELPSTYEDLLALPGFGPYTAAAVASIAFGEPVPVVDGNVLRVFARYWGIADDIGKPATKQAISRRLEGAIAKSPPADFNQAMMELGALVCRPRQPTCLLCPLQPDCIACRDGRLDELPAKAPRKAVPHHRLAVALIRDGNRLAIVQRPPDVMLGGLWELPGGRLAPGEDPTAALPRLVRERCGATVFGGEPVATIRHAYSHFTIELTANACTLLAPATGLTWVDSSRLDDYPFDRATLKLLETVLASPSD